MRVLLSTIGGRGEVQPLLALGVRLKGMGRQVRVCAPPDFQGLAAEHGLSFTAIGQELREGAWWPLEDRDRRVSKVLAEQFTALAEAAQGCDVIVAADQGQVAARTVAESHGARYLHVARSPISLPSRHHAPLVRHDGANTALWQRAAERRNAVWQKALNTLRAEVGLRPVDDVTRHVLTERPLLAADPVLAPWPGAGLDVRQTGAWVLPDRRPLPPETREFLAAGEPPVYLGLNGATPPGSHRVITPPADGSNTVDNGNRQALFSRMAVVVHHGDPGTTTTAARAGVPQVVVPRSDDQLYFAQRVQQLGIGIADPASLTDAIDHALTPEVTARARALATRMRSDGTSIAALYIR